MRQLPAPYSQRRVPYLRHHCPTTNRHQLSLRIYLSLPQPPLLHSHGQHLRQDRTRIISARPSPRLRSGPGPENIARSPESRRPSANTRRCWQRRWKWCQQLERSERCAKKSCRGGRGKKKRTQTRTTFVCARFFLTDSFLFFSWQARAKASSKGGKLQSQLNAQKKKNLSSTLAEASNQELRARDADEAAQARNWE